MSELETPVAFLVFNRPETTRQVFEAIEAARPARLLLVADGPRSNREGETKRCEQVRQIVQNVTWPCQIETNFALDNMGCRGRVISGLDWVFSRVEEAIILEDDCLPNPSFFRFCSELLCRFRGDDRIGMIAGTNLAEKRFQIPYSYALSQTVHAWGWATWRSAWARYDRDLKTWPAVKRDGLLGEIFDNPRVVRYWSALFDRVHGGLEPTAWDYQWFYTNLCGHMLSVVPEKNLITNIGFGPDATHTKNPKSDKSVPSGSLQFPLRHPPALVPLRTMDRIDWVNSYLPSLKQRLSGRIRHLIKAVTGSNR